VLETNGDEQGTRENLARKQKRQPDNVCNNGVPLSPAPGGVGKSRLGGELRREEQRYLGRGSALIKTGHSTAYARGFFVYLTPPSSGTTGVAQEHISGTPVATSASRSAGMFNALAAHGAGCASWRIAINCYSYLVHN
jgi:hypothetical protein